ncbi:putative PAS/PAC sensor protein [Streptomyces davaonensis JCM 4913]|uniref:Putative PAS/PAC sensor protein n=1 Tax=Streptomyces davaonensis (strain DSM 101723 / JCM 4913 / KCC S-0913 / 768) TaxID=1214101 RepID=K4QZ59_STRDJ|nr:SpoIIE family protein phosphatase [Streptomyces davaonensis]CCK25674.1 putative PAS/PAC sensor protein [Streptomyces davaonensis JCM 4913]
MNSSDQGRAQDPSAAPSGSWADRAEDGSGEWQIGHSLVGQFLARSPIGMAVMDTDLRYVWINDALERLGGVAREERLGRRLSEVLPRLDAAAIESVMQEVLETGRPAVDVEYHGRTSADPDREHAYSTSFFRLADDSGVVRGVCYMVLDVTDRWRARERLSLLSRAGAWTARTLDVFRLAEGLAEVCVPDLADLITVDLLDSVLQGESPDRALTGGQRLRRVAVRSADGGAPEGIAVVGRPVQFPPGSPGARCLASGAPHREAVSGPGCEGWIAADALLGPAAPDLGPCALLLVPVRTHGRVVGMTTLLRRAPREPFDEDDLLVADEIVGRAALGVENARQYTKERNTALALQRFLLPRRIAAQSTVEVATRYLPSGGGVGGDWFDVIPLSGARVALVIGDVVGHGINAAASMGRLRTAVRTLADLDLPPEEILAHLDDLMLGLIAEESPEERGQAPSELGATCLYAVYDPVARTCVMARAGHPPPAVVGPDRSVYLPDLPPGPPLGLGGLPFESAEIELPEGSLLALYTDGLFEVRGQDPDVGLERLRAALANPDRPVEDMCGEVQNTLEVEGRDDDVALLIARIHGLGTDRVASWDIASDPAAVSGARAVAGRCLEAWDLGDMVFTTELLVSELVTNAIRYASGPIRLRLIRASVLTCEVYDASSVSPRLQHARTLDEGGRGLFLVAQLSRRWGTRYTAEGKVIWVEQEIL